MLPTVSLTDSLIGVSITYLVPILPLTQVGQFTINTLNSPATNDRMAWLLQNQTSRGTALGPLMAGAIITSLAVLILSLNFQRNVTTGITAGAVKG